jgi:hypothetical protein
LQDILQLWSNVIHQNIEPADVQADYDLVCRTR